MKHASADEKRDGLAGDSFTAAGESELFGGLSLDTDTGNVKSAARG